MKIKNYPFFKCILMITFSTVIIETTANQSSDYAEGYYAFEEGPGLTPPSARKPPYTQTNALCAGLLPQNKGFNNLYNNLCGDLSRGFLPQNPMGQAPLGETYPFELIKNKTLEFLSESLPVLREDNTIPKVAKFQGQITNGAFPRKRKKRNTRDMQTEDKTSGTVNNDRMARSGGSPSPRAICDGSDGILCRVFSTFFPQRSGQPITTHRQDNIEYNDVASIASSTPCPSKAEYATPIFAKNYQGLWRYVVQIPYEGYLTQTVEITRCLQGQCNFIEGQCLSSPRWVSLLVAEIFYPNVFFPTTPPHSRVVQSTPIPHLDVPPPVADFQNFQQYLNKRSSNILNTPTMVRRSSFSETPSDISSNNNEYCDGHDNIGCFQIRLFNDWFLVPGACKCWKVSNKNVLLRK